MHGQNHIKFQEELSLSLFVVVIRMQLRLITTALGWLLRPSLDKPPVLHFC